MSLSINVPVRRSLIAAACVAAFADTERERERRDRYRPDRQSELERLQPEPDVASDHLGQQPLRRSRSRRDHEVELPLRGRFRADTDEVQGGSPDGRQHLHNRRRGGFEVPAVDTLNTYSTRISLNRATSSGSTSKDPTSSIAPCPFARPPDSFTTGRRTRSSAAFTAENAARRLGDPRARLRLRRLRRRDPGLRTSSRLPARPRRPRSPAGPRTRRRRRPRRSSSRPTSPARPSSARSTAARLPPARSPDTSRSRRASTRFSVRAKDAAGNVDGSPATDDWKVKKKKKKK